MDHRRWKPAGSLPSNASASAWAATFRRAAVAAAFWASYSPAAATLSASSADLQVSQVFDSCIQDNGRFSVRSAKDTALEVRLDCDDREYVSQRLMFECMRTLIFAQPSAYSGI